MKIVISKKQPALVDGRYEVSLTTEIARNEDFSITLNKLFGEAGVGVIDIRNKDTRKIVSRYMLSDGDVVDIMP